jgi:hypothetical protein
MKIVQSLISVFYFPVMLARKTKFPQIVEN